MLIKTRFTHWCGAILIGCAAALATPALAASNEALMELLKIMRDKGTITAGEYESLVNAAKADAEVVEDTKIQLEAKTKDLPKVTTKDKIVVQSKDEDFEWQFIGRVMADYIATDSDETALQSGFELRRARLGVEATLWEHWIGKLEADLAENEVDIKDAFVGYESKTAAGHKWWIKVGQSHFPSGFSTLSSSKYMTFMNRPIYADGEIQLARLMGLSAFMAGENKRWTVHAGVHGRASGDQNTDCTGPADDDECDDPIYAGLRVTGVPFMRDKTHLFHIGGSVQYRNPNGNTIDIDQRDAVIHVIENKNLNADFLGLADDAWGWGVEGAAVWGPAHLKGEYVTLDVDIEPDAGLGFSSSDLDAWSVDLGFFLTGESKNFDGGKAQWGSIKPKGIVDKGGKGAWEVAVRYEEADYNDPPDINGEMHLFTAGLNWYVNNTMRFMANYVTTVNYEEPGNSDDDDEPSAFMVRGQIYW